MALDIVVLIPWNKNSGDGPSFWKALFYTQVEFVASKYIFNFIQVKEWEKIRQKKRDGF